MHTLHSHHCCHRVIGVERWETWHHREATGLLRRELLALLMRGELLALLLRGELLALLLQRKQLTRLLWRILLTRLHMLSAHEVAATTSAPTTPCSLDSAILEPTIVVIRLPLESLIESSFPVGTARGDGSSRAAGGILRRL